MFHLLIILQCLIFIAGCSALSDSTTETFKPVTDSNYRYVTERISFFPPSGTGWQSSYNGETGTMNFFYDQEGIRNLVINIVPFRYTLNANSFRTLANEKNDISPVFKGNIQCLIVKKVRQNSHSNGIINTYYCEEPSQPIDFPPIQIIQNEMVAPNVPFTNPDTILAPIWNSLQFKPVDRANSVAYQNWKKKNAEYRVRFPDR